MKIMNVCPTCGDRDTVYLLLGVAVKLDGSPMGGRTPGVCNSYTCDQRYWYYPENNRVTRRNVGHTYDEWRKMLEESRASLHLVNIARVSAGLTELQEVPPTLITYTDDDDIVCFKRTPGPFVWSPVLYAWGWLVGKVGGLREWTVRRCGCNRRRKESTNG